MRILLLITLIFSCGYSKPYLTVPPVDGSLCTKKDKDFDGLRYYELIPHCKRNVSTKRKDKICKRDGIHNRRDFIVDHIIPLSIGGSNKDDNLWCQHKTLQVTAEEYRAYLKLKTGEWSQAIALDYILDLKFNR